MWLLLPRGSNLSAVSSLNGRTCLLHSRRCVEPSVIAETDISRVVDLYMGASESTLDRRRSVVDRLEALQSSGDIDRFRVQSWPRRVVVDGPNEDLVALVERFQQWADAAGVSFGPAFDRWHYDRSFTGESGELLSFPTVALAVYEGDELVEVAPHHDGQKLRTVDEVLAALDEGPERSHERTAAVDEPM